MVHRNARRASRGVLAALVATGATFVVAGAPAGAAVNATVTDGDLTITADAADAITVTCVGEEVKVNGANPTPTTDCDLIDTISITGAGAFANVIDLSGVANVAATVGDFDTLATVTVDAGPGDDTITGTALADQLTGGTGDDTITGFRGNDTMIGGDDDDTMIWNNGDGTDVMQGGVGDDVAQVNGSTGATGDTFTIAASATAGDVRFDRTNLVPFGIEINTSETLDVNGLAGDDSISSSQVNGTGGLAALIDLDLDGGDGNDTIVGGDGDDLLSGGLGNDTLTGFRGADAMVGGDGDDVMIWNNGDGTDTMDGEAGTDTARVNGNVTGGDALTIAASVTPGRVQFNRTNLVPFGVDIGTSETLEVNGLGGDDTITSSQVIGVGGLAALIALDLDGGDGNDTIVGGDGADLLGGGAGNDTLTGFRGADTMAGDDGDDVMIWNNGDGSDVMEGGAGTDTARANGSAAGADTFTLAPSATPGRARFDRTNLVPFFLDIGTAELMDVRDAGTTTPDTFTVFGSAGADDVSVTPDGSTGFVLPTTHQGIETLTYATLEGDDEISARAGALAYTIDGGAGTADVLTVDGGGQIVSTSTVNVTGAQPITTLGLEHIGFVNTAPRGYWVLGAAGAVTPAGTAQALGNASALPLNQPIVGGAATPSGAGYWLVGGDGGVFSFGNAGFFGSTGNIRLNQPIVGMTATPSGLGYWFVAADGGVFAYGDAEFFGSMGGTRLNQPIVGMTATPTGDGYWLVARDGGIFAFGDALFAGSTGNITLNQPIVGMAATLTGQGYWFVAADGGIFSFGDAPFLGSTGGSPPAQPIVGMAASPTGDGYWFVTRSGQVIGFGDATVFTPATAPASPVVGIIDRAL